MPAENSIVYEWTSELEANAFENCNACFALTTGRTGTMWLSNVLASADLVRPLHEPFPPLFIENRRAMDGDPLPHDALVRLIRTCRLGALRSAQGRNLVYVELAPWWSHFADAALEAFSCLKFLHLVRDPRAFVVSALSKGWFLERTRGTHLWPKSNAHLPRYEQAIAFWVAVNSRSLEFKKRHPDKVLTLKSEDMWSDAKHTQHFLRWIGVPGSYVQRLGGFLDTQLNRTANGAPGDRPGWDPEWDGYLAEVAGPTMVMLGYELP